MTKASQDQSRRGGGHHYHHYHQHDDLNEEKLMQEACKAYDHQRKRDAVREKDSPVRRCSMHYDCPMGQSCEFDFGKGYRLCTITYPDNICVGRGDTQMHRDIQQRLRSRQCEEGTSGEPCAIYRCASTTHSSKTAPVLVPIHVKDGFCSDVRLNKIILRDASCTPLKLG